MKTVQLSELGALAEPVKNGEAIEIRDGNEIVAKVIPTRESTLEERIAAAMAREPDVPDWFFDEDPPKFPGSVLEQLLHDRRSRDW